MKTIMEMAREVGAIHIHGKPKEFAVVGNKNIEAFAELVRESERDRVLKILDEQGTWAHTSDLIELVTAEANARANASWTLMCEKMVAIEREACAELRNMFHPIDGNGRQEMIDVMNRGLDEYQAAIRARGQA